MYCVRKKTPQKRGVLRNVSVQQTEAAQLRRGFPNKQVRASCNAITGVALPRLNAMSSIRSLCNTASTLDPQGGYRISNEHRSVSLAHSGHSGPCKLHVWPS